MAHRPQLHILISFAFNVEIVLEAVIDDAVTGNIITKRGCLEIDRRFNYLRHIPPTAERNIIDSDRVMHIVRQGTALRCKLAAGSAIFQEPFLFSTESINSIAYVRYDVILGAGSGLAKHWNEEQTSKPIYIIEQAKETKEQAEARKQREKEQEKQRQRELEAIRKGYLGRQ